MELTATPIYRANTQRAQATVSAPSALATPATASARTLYFGKNAPKPIIGPGLFVSSVRAYTDVPTKSIGGLTTVSMTIPYGVQTPFEIDGKEYGGIKIDLIAPHYKAVKEANAKLDNPFKDTGITTEIQYDNGPKVPFSLLKRQETNEKGQTITAFEVSSPLFDGIDNPYMAGKTKQERDDAAFHVLSVLTGKDPDTIQAMIKADNTGTDYKGNWTAALLNATFNRAVAELMKQYQEKNPDEARHKFAISNDWVAGTLPAFFDKVGMNDMAEIYYLHNTHDQGLGAADAEKIGISKDFLEKYKAVHTVRNKKTRQKSQATSFADIGMARANGVIMSTDYARRVANPDSGLATEMLYLPRLQAMLNEKRVYDMHHVTEGEFNLFNSKSLGKDGFVHVDAKDLNELTTEKIHAFKAANKANLQKRLGLDENPNAIIAGFLGHRQDPNQKGIETVLSAAPKLLEKNPNLQLVIMGPPVANETRLQELHDDLQKRFPGRIYGKPEGINGDDRIQMPAGCDVLLMPSSYEPFGLGHIEGMGVGCVALTTNHDGLVKSNLDPFIDGDSDDPRLKKLLDEFGQTGFKAPEYHSGKYHKAVGKLQPSTDDKPKKPITESDKAIMAEAEEGFISAMQRAIDLHESDPSAFDQLQLNAVKFVFNAHSWPRITPLYGKAILGAMDHKGITDKYLAQTQFSGRQKHAASRLTVMA